MAVPLFDMVVFATLIGAGLVLRNRPDTHKRLMTLGTIALTSAPIARLPFVRPLGPPGFFGLTDLFIVAHDADQTGGQVPRPWRLAFQADPTLPTIVHLLLGMNAHINYDLPPATLSVITDHDFEDPVLIDRRRRDHERIDRILVARVAAEDHAIGGARSLLDRILTPANRLSSRRFLREARGKVWLNVAELQRARREGENAYDARLAELELLTAAKIADLLRPGQVLPRLAMTGFGVTLPPP